MKEHAVAATQAYSGRAIGSLVIGLASLVFVSVSAWLGLIVATVAIFVALISRRELKARSDLRGFGLSLAGFMAGALVLLFWGLPIVMSTAFVTVAWIR
jgi:hypothetical protein